MTEQEKLIDVLDDVTASLETVLLHQGKQMTPADYAARKALTAKARNLVNTHSYDADDGDETALDAKEWSVMVFNSGTREPSWDVVHEYHEGGENGNGGVDHLCEIVMDYEDSRVRQHASILAGSIRVLKAAEAVLIGLSRVTSVHEAILNSRLPSTIQELADAVKVSRTPFQEK